jgi:DNA polymerase-3 subunit gamma/tau
MQSLGVIDDVQYYKIIQCVVTAKVAEAMKLINDLMLQGKNSEQIIKGLEAYIRTMMIIKSCPNNLSEFEFSEEEITRISEQTNKIDLDTILNMLNSIKEIQKAVEVNLELQYFLERFVLKTIMEIARKRKAKTS